MKARTPLARWIAVGLAWFALFGGALPARAEASPAEQEIGCVLARERAPSTARSTPRAAVSRPIPRAPPSRSAGRERPQGRGTPLFLAHRALLR